MNKLTPDPSNNEEKSTHEQLVEHILEYLRWERRFTEEGTQRFAARARNALTQIKNLCTERRAEIFQERIDLYGHIRKGIPPKISPDDPMFRGRRRRRMKKKD